MAQKRFETFSWYFRGIVKSHLASFVSNNDAGYSLRTCKRFSTSRFYDLVRGLHSLKRSVYAHLFENSKSNYRQMIAINLIVYLTFADKSPSAFWSAMMSHIYIIVSCMRYFPFFLLHYFSLLFLLRYFYNFIILYYYHLLMIFIVY